MTSNWKNYWVSFSLSQVQGLRLSNESHLGLHSSSSQRSPMNVVNVYTGQDMGSRALIGSLPCRYFNRATAGQLRKRKRIRRLLREFCQ